MPWGLFDRITNLFDKSFLFASFLPTLVFLGSIGATLALPIGLEPAFGLLTSLDATQAAFASAALSAASVVLAYLVAGIRPTLVAFWAGTLKHVVFRPFYALAQILQRRRYDMLCARLAEEPEWDRVLANFQSTAASCMNQMGARYPVEKATTARIRRAIRELSATATTGEVECVTTQVAQLYSAHAVQGLEPIYRPLLQMLKERVEREQQEVRDAFVMRDREFGPIASIRPTRLGNITEAYLSYPFKRYQMESDAFWPALRSVVPTTYLTVLDESRVYVDFSLTMASLACVYGGLALWVGPWIWWAPRLWIALTMTSLVVAYFFYSMAVMSMAQYGDVHRACIDLHRLLLMKALHRDRPGTLSAERTQWRELSQIAVYGDTEQLDFPITKAEGP